MDFENRIIEGVKAYFAFRFLLACLGFFVGMIAGVCFVGYWVFDEIRLELSYQHKYGDGWKMEFERYHGTIAHAHMQIAVCIACMIALVLVVSWFCHKTFHLHRRHKRRGHVK